MDTGADFLEQGPEAAASAIVELTKTIERERETTARWKDRAKAAEQRLSEPGGATTWIRTADNPAGLEPDQALEKILGEYSLKAMQDPGRERSLVITYLETAIAWEQRRRVIRGEAFIGDAIH